MISDSYILHLNGSYWNGWKWCSVPAQGKIYYSTSDAWRAAEPLGADIVNTSHICYKCSGTGRIKYPGESAECCDACGGTGLIPLGTSFVRYQKREK